MHALLALTVANIRSYIRDRAALFWTLAFPLVFIVLFGLIFQGSRHEPDARLGRRRRVRRPRPSSRQASRRSSTASTLVETDADRRARPDADRQGRRRRRRPGRLRRRADGRRPRAAPRSRSRSTPTRRGRSSRARSTRRSGRSSASSTSAAGRRSSCPSPQTVQTENLNAISYFVPSMLGLSIMQVGIFAAIPLVGRPREAHPQAPGRDAAAALAAGRLERPDAGPHRLHPGGHHRRRRDARSSGSRSPAACWSWPAS